MSPLLMWLRGQLGQVLSLQFLWESLQLEPTVLRRLPHQESQQPALVWRELLPVPEWRPQSLEELWRGPLV